MVSVGVSDGGGSEVGDGVVFGTTEKGGPFDMDDYITRFRLEHPFEPVLSLAAGDEGDPDPLQFKNIQVFDPRARDDPDARRFYVACVEFNLPDTKSDDGEETEIDDPNDLPPRGFRRERPVDCPSVPSPPTTAGRSIIPPMDATAERSTSRRTSAPPWVQLRGRNLDRPQLVSDPLWKSLDCTITRITS